MKIVTAHARKFKSTLLFTPPLRNLEKEICKRIRHMLNLIKLVTLLVRFTLCVHRVFPVSPSPSLASSLPSSISLSLLPPCCRFHPSPVRVARGGPLSFHDFRSIVFSPNQVIILVFFYGDESSVLIFRSPMLTENSTTFSIA